MGVKNQKLRQIYIILIIFLLLLLINLPQTLADDYYADIIIDVDNSGFVSIDGITDHPDLLTVDSQEYTSKKQSYWLLNITTEGDFSDFIFILTLPEGSSINYIKSSGSIRIEEEFGRLLVKGFGENESFSIIVQYQIEKNTDNNSLDFYLFLILLSVIIIVIIIAIIIMVNKRDKNIKKIEKTIDKFDEYNFRGLNDRQKKIMKLLIDSKRPLTQTDIQKELEIPKAAVSRNIRGLELKGLIEKEKIGMSNLIRLKKP